MSHNFSFCVSYGLVNEAFDDFPIFVHRTSSYFSCLCPVRLLIALFHDEKFRFKIIFHDIKVRIKIVLYTSDISVSP